MMLNYWPNFKPQLFLYFFNFSMISRFLLHKNEIKNEENNEIN
jgi:hypothetical protein